MQVRLSKPELERFIDEQVKAGHFPSADAVIEAGVARLMSDSSTDSVDDTTLDAIDAAEDQVERGEFREWKGAAAELRTKFLDK
jgi:Arc/MetJ-type ribon-helix-helix transcriptional regulator